MIASVIEQRGDEFWVVIPDGAMERFQLQVGDTIAFIPQTGPNGKSGLTPDLDQSADEIFSENEEAFRFLADRWGTLMIEAVIRQDGDDFVVTIPSEAMDRYQLRVGDTISFTPILLGRPRPLSDTVEQALGDVIRNDQDALKYLAGEESGKPGSIKTLQLEVDPG